MNEWPAVGRRVLLSFGHPWGGHLGTVVAITQIRRRGLPYPRIRLDDGDRDAWPRYNPAAPLPGRHWAERPH